jgi:ketosteroid isomerase-like protein
MPEENVALVRRSIDLFNRGEVDGAMEGLHGDCEMDWSNSIGPLKGIYRGHDQIREFWRSFLEAWDDVHWEIEELIDVDESRLIVVNQVRMRGLGSGAEVKATGVQLWTIHAGRAQSIKLFQSKADALEATGPAR